MKTPLNYQIAESDCGYVSVLNAISYLLERKQIPGYIVKDIAKLTLDRSFMGRIGNGGTSKSAIKEVASYLNTDEIKIRCELLEKENVTINNIYNGIKAGSCALLYVYQLYEHYVIATDIDDKYIYIWDPYYLNKNTYIFDKDVEIITDKPFLYNRKVSLKRLDSDSHLKDFSLGHKLERQCVLFYKEK